MFPVTIITISILITFISVIIIIFNLLSIIIFFVIICRVSEKRYYDYLLLLNVHRTQRAKKLRESGLLDLERIVFTGMSYFVSTLSNVGMIRWNEKLS